jgi:rhodanese-related sulfurtransferase
MNPRARTFALLAVAAASALSPALAACSSGDGSTPAAAEAEAASSTAATALAEQRTPIDVRTPEEHAASHVEGTLLIDVQAADFDARIGELDREGAYVVYCRSGNRSAQAAARMRALGLDVVDGGALTDMAAGGWATT